MTGKKKRLQRVISFGCATAMLSSVLSGCGGTSQTAAQTQSGASGSGNGKLSFSWTVPYNNEQPTSSNSVVLQLEKKTNSQINIQWEPMISYGDKYNVLISSGQLPEALLVPDLKASTFLDAAKSDQFWDLTPYLSSGEFPNFKNFNPIAVKNVQTEGKNYVLPRERVVKRQMVCYRSDWAKKAGLGAPDTLDKLYTMAKTFAQGDFDGNGKKDTTGLLLGTVTDNGGGGQTIDCLKMLAVANGGYNGWGLKDGQVTSYMETPEFLKTIQLLRKMCSEGIVSKDFSITKTTAQVNNFIDKEKAGLWLTYTVPGLNDPLYVAKKKTNPNLKRSDIYGYTFMKDASGKPRIPAEIGYNCGIAIPKSSVKDEAKLKQILKVFDYVCSKDGQNLVSLGIEGKHYQKTGDTTCKVLNPDLFANEVDTKTNQMSLAGGAIYDVVDDDIGSQLAKDRRTYNDSDLIQDVSAPLISNTYSTQISSLNQQIDTALFKYILGESGDSDFQSAISKWKSAGGDKIAQEYTADYNKSNKK